ncbi:MAG: DM13 domain-containing protein [Blastocatellia bacterium]
MMNRLKLVLIMLVTVLLTAATVALRRQHSQAMAGIIAIGRFHQVAHKGSGTAILYRTADGQRMLALDDLVTGAGQQLMVGLIAAPDAYENEAVERAAFVPLGEWRPGQARLIYQVPAEVDLARYRAVTIWNRQYHVNFTTAPLRQP